MTTQATAARLYVGTYAKYNNGSVNGAWLDLSDYSDAAAFMTACAELHSDEQDPEFMFQDYEGFPASFYGESMNEEELEKLYSCLEIIAQLEDMDAAGWVSLHNQYCDNQSMSDDTIHSFDDDFFATYFEGKPMEAARAASFGNLNWSDDYIMFNGYGNLVSINDSNVFDHISKSDVERDIYESPENYSL